jgi:hypothetical protein
LPSLSSLICRPLCSLPFGSGLNSLSPNGFSSSILGNYGSPLAGSIGNWQSNGRITVDSVLRNPLNGYSFGTTQIGRTSSFGNRYFSVPTVFPTQQGLMLGNSTSIIGRLLQPTNARPNGTNSGATSYRV